MKDSNLIKLDEKPTKGKKKTNTGKKGKKGG